MDGFINWIITNKEWLFSGIGGAVIVGIISIILTKRQSSCSQSIRSGKNSTNYQAGRDIRIKTKNNGNNA